MTCRMTCASAVFTLFSALATSVAFAQSGSSASSVEKFDFQQVVDKARQLAEQPYQAPPETPAFLRELSYDDYQAIRFKPESSLWLDEGSNFNAMLVPPGLFYNHTVKVNVIEDDVSKTLGFDKSKFTYPNAHLEKLIPADLGYAGFKLTFPLTGPNVQNQFLVFSGASYYRAVGRDNNFGISARGIALNTGLAGGEEFPSFVEFWLKKPGVEDRVMTFFALLDGPSVAGAYHFTVTPGDETTVTVRTMLFPRKNIELFGVAPLTSMFFYGENTRKPAGEWRPEVHDSDGLLIHDGPSNEWLWRPLRNPESLTMDYFSTENVRGFGLIQRDTHFTNYMDQEAHYQSRPSTWIETQGQWGKGQVVLVQLPTPDETNDNIVAFWKPEAQVTAGNPLQLSYSARFGGKDIARETLGKTQDTFVGDGSIVGGGNQAGAVRVIVDFAGGPLDILANNAPVVGSVTAMDDGEVIEHFVEYVASLKRWRLSILARPASGKSLSLRAFLKQEEQTLTETWTYQLPAGHDILRVIK